MDLFGICIYVLIYLIIICLLIFSFILKGVLKKIVCLINSFGNLFTWFKISRGH